MACRRTYSTSTSRVTTGSIALGKRAARYGVTSWLDPANNFSPADVTTDLALPVGEPSFARLPSTVIESPTRSVSRFQPARIRALGLFSSTAHFVVLLVAASTTSTY